jgi:excinuclease ABC subunit C
VEHALRNAREALERRLAESATQRKLLEGLAEILGLEQTPERIEVYDNSHVYGTHAYGAMIVAGPEGFLKNQYRKFAIKTAAPRATAGGGRAEGGVITPGDDYGMMREVLTRRFARAQKEDPDREHGLWPDLVLIDGGKGQLNAALGVFADLGIDDVPVVAIAKGPDRHAGRETFHMAGRTPFILPERDPVLYFLQRLRDEAHRFAIGAHRGKRSQVISRSALDDIPGIGLARKRALLHHFGSARSVANAALKDLEAVEGISLSVAKKIYDHFHPDR